MKIRPVGAESYHAHRQTKLIVAFRNFANASKNCRYVLVSNSVLHIHGIPLFADLYGALGLCGPGTVFRISESFL